MIGGSPAAISDTGWTTTSPSRSLRSVPRCAFVFASSGLGPRFIVEAYGRRHGQHPRREPEKKAGRREAKRPTNVIAAADRQRDGFHNLQGLAVGADVRLHGQPHVHEIYLRAKGLSHRAHF